VRIEVAPAAVAGLEEESRPAGYFRTRRLGTRLPTMSVANMRIVAIRRCTTEFRAVASSRRRYPEEYIVDTIRNEYFTAYRNLKLTRDPQGVLVVQLHDNGGPLTFTADAHTEVVDAFYRISQDRGNKIVILTGAGGDFMVGVDWSSFKDVSDPGVWSQIHDEGVQVLENMANIRVPVIAAIEGRAHIHSEYALLANVVVAAEDATFQDVGHFAAGVVPGDGIFTAWSYRAGAGRAEAFLLNPRPISARTALEWGVVAEVVKHGETLSRAREIAAQYLKFPEVTRRNTRVHFIRPLKERIIREVGYGLSLEGASAADLVKSMRRKD
jgi:enoyl-CoA hydratase/carnithine racemase